MSYTQNSTVTKYHTQSDTGLNHSFLRPVATDCHHPRITGEASRLVVSLRTKSSFNRIVILHHESRIENVVLTIWPCYTRLVKDPKTQRPKGFGFVSFRSEDEAQKALEAMNGRLEEG
ncbi:hypothetical protein Dsin_029488 [Dipteronia sinensis]|uniref:RRM domain-containing protein n=1 Tax=Dipteronia sinensis TaxID=43782 RepID=A0AAE0DWS3_9ROSI|nr:hypothetical protein Dsin_029488 [Dipteronia sinensis]